MESITVTVPAKIVLFGEYMVLRGCQAIGATLRENHCIQISEAEGSSVHIQTHPRIDLVQATNYVQRLWKTVATQQGILSTGVNIAYESSFPPGYGWGGSSALALSLLVFGYQIQHPGSEINAQKIWQGYLQLQMPGSAIDAYCQIRGGDWISYKMNQAYETDSDGRLPFLNFVRTHPVYFISTRQKADSAAEVARFSTVDISGTQVQHYQRVWSRLLEAIAMSDFDSFQMGVSELTEFIFSYVQASLSYVHFFNRVKERVGELGVLKPCGALGGDGLLLFVREKDNGVLQLLRQDEILPIPLSLGGRPLCVQRNP